MKKVETTFICDDCGAPLPNEYIKTGVDEQYFDIRNYNSAHFPVNTNCFIHVHVGLNVVVDYGGTYRELCPKCRVKWLKKALSQFEEVLRDGKDDMPTLTQPNEPLTLEELREMDGHPVWVKQLKGLSVCDTDWAVVEFRLEPDVKDDKIRVWWPGSEDEDTPSEDDYGKTWLAYRRPPVGEEETP